MEQSSTMNPYSIFDLFPEKVRKCDGGCGGTILEPWSWKIGDKFYCGDCASEKIESQKPVEKQVV